MTVRVLVSVCEYWNLIDIVLYFVFFFFKQKTAYDMRISDWSSDVCSSDLYQAHPARHLPRPAPRRQGSRRHGDEGRGCRHRAVRHLDAYPRPLLLDRGQVLSHEVIAPSRGLSRAALPTHDQPPSSFSVPHLLLLSSLSLFPCPIWHPS